MGFNRSGWNIEAAGRNMKDYGPYKCYICGKPLEGDNASLEHIVLNGIGGKLRSRTLLCKK